MKRIQCPCGKVLAIRDGSRSVKFRCPACGLILRIRTKPARETAAQPATATAPAADDQGYEVVHESEPVLLSNADAHSSPPDEAWVPSERLTTATTKERRAHSMPWSAVHGSSDEIVGPDEFPGPFIDRSALLFPFLHPTWPCWIGLSIITAVALAAVAFTAFFFAIIMTFGAFASLFTFGSMVLACVALTGYVITAFENVFEQTANGDNRFSKLPGLAFSENLPPFLRMAGAVLSTAAIAAGIVYLLRNRLGPWESEDWVINPMIIFKMMLIFDFVTWALFPIFLISNSVEQSIWPIWALHTTIPRLMKCGGHYIVFLIVSAVCWIGLNAIIGVLAFIHIWLALVAIGPLLAMYLLYYAHWLGRVVRQMMVIE